jgi:hypothetical protein
MKSHAECLEEFREIAEFEAQNRERWLDDLRFGFASAISSTYRTPTKPTRWLLSIR